MGARSTTFQKARTEESVSRTRGAAGATRPMRASWSWSRTMPIRGRCASSLPTASSRTTSARSARRRREPVRSSRSSTAADRSDGYGLTAALHALHVEVDGQQVLHVERMHDEVARHQILVLLDLDAVVLLAPPLAPVQQVVDLVARSRSECQLDVVEAHVPKASQERDAGYRPRRQFADGSAGNSAKTRSLPR